MIISTIILVIILIILIAAFWCVATRPDSSHKITYGASFSKPYAEDLGLDWKKVYISILDDLKIKSLRLIAYWPEIESEQGKLNFEDLDWQIEEARKRDVEVILAIGYKLPRWPECFYPSWTDKMKQPEKERQLLDMEKKIVEHYKNYPNVKMWQIENEPLVEWFGDCPKPSKELLEKEIKLVKSLDNRPILITDSGELSSWSETAHLGDVFGTTMYRTVWNQYLKIYLDYWFIPPCFYRLKASLNRLPADKVIISELQAEPWFPRGFSEDVTLAEQYKSMDAEKLRKNLDYAKKTGFPKAYIWGVEWWYWLKEKGDDSVWKAGKELINN